VPGLVRRVPGPSALSLLTVTFSDQRERGKALTVYSAVAGAGGAIGLLLGGLLTEYLSWRWCLYVNLIFAGIAVAGALGLLRRQPSGLSPKLDLPGAALVSGGMFCVLYGFSNAALHGWHSASCWASLAVGGGALTAFGWWQTRAAHPLLPPRIVTDQTRAGAYLAILIAAIGLFGTFLFVSYYLQQTLGFSPVRTGLVFLPMIACFVLFTNVSNLGLMPRTGPRPLVPAGLLVAATGLALLTRIGVHSSYASGVLPSLLMVGAGFGFAMAPSFSTGTFGVQPQDAGVASATLNTGQQLGGSIGTSLLNTVFASSVAGYITSHLSPAPLVRGKAAPQLLALASIHGYKVAFWTSAAILAAGAVLAATLMRSGPLSRQAAGLTAAHGQPAAAEAAAPSQEL
jgi:predicted MFS family arabinose efflux permease